MDTQKIAKAISLLNSMILSGEQHSETSIKIMREAMGEIDKGQVKVEPEVKPELAIDERQFLRLLVMDKQAEYEKEIPTDFGIVKIRKQQAVYKMKALIEKLREPISV